MSTHRRPRKLVQLSAALGLMAAAALGGYAAADAHAPAASGLAEAANVSGSGHSLTIYACLADGRLSHVSTKAPKCYHGSSLVQWSAQSGPAAGGQPQPTPTTTASSKPSTKPSSPSSTPPTTPSSTPPSSGTGTAACVTSANDGSCGPYTFAAISGSHGGQTHVIQDVWNPIGGISQTLSANSPADWSVKASMPASNTAVLSYPDTQQIYTTDNNTPNPLSGYASITSNYTETGPSTKGNDWEAAYDIWAGTGSNNYAQEIMIWVDNQGQRPAGNVVASATIDGQSYKIWSTGQAGTVGNPVSMVLDSNQASGSVNLLDDLNWLKSSGYMPAGSGINQIDFGFELCSTGGVPETFAVSNYGIKATCTSGSSCTN